MDKIIIFSGTYEGRTLSRMLCDESIEHMVCVASEYGSDVMAKSPCVRIHVGRMDAKEIRDLFIKEGLGRDDIVVDATHPYAQMVSENISTAVKETGCRLYRIKRKSLEVTGEDLVKCHAAMADLAAYVDRTEGNIMLTTGSRDIGAYAEAVSKDTLLRTYVRVIPATESIEACTGAGIGGDHIIAMQGPFSYELNRAIFSQYDIRHMVTKDSGRAGGFGEKTEAAISLGIKVHVLERPLPETDREGYGVSEIYEMITKKKPENIRRISLCGTGPGGSGPVTKEVRDAVRSADALFGAGSVLDKAVRAVFGEAVSGMRRYDTYDAGEIRAVLEENQDIKSAAVVFSGDSGSYSGAGSCYKKLKEEMPDTKISVLPGISSVSYMASRLGISYDDAKIMSLHGDTGLHNIEKLVRLIRYNRKTFCLVSKADDTGRIAGILKDRGLSPLIYMGRNLSYEDETIEELTAEEAADGKTDGKITLLFINKRPERRPLVPVPDDAMFIRDAVPMTKECVRHESILRLGLREGDLVFDIGGGTGSVAIGIASLDPSLRVVTIEKDPEAAG
ncbi:MAG: precorrin-6A reductase, partial [Lachnospiraceae bacterium]|nr:precorrin-6A reductase [Lachnospiraceae bacterium]